jgi:hypothetical protein
LQDDGMPEELTKPVEAESGNSVQHDKRLWCLGGSELEGRQ